MQRSSPFSTLLSRVGNPRPDFSGRKRAVRPLAAAAGALLERLGGREQARMVRLWQNWAMVMGADIAPLAIPLGSRKQILLVGGEDNMAMQELTYQIPEMLERANAFMDSAYFDKVELHLMLGRTPLDAGIVVPTSLPPRFQPSRPKQLGALLGSFDPDSAVGRCYAAYVRAFDGP